MMDFKTSSFMRLNKCCIKALTNASVASAAMTPTAMTPVSTVVKSSANSCDKNVSAIDTNVSLNTVAVCLPANSLSNVVVNHFINKNGNKGLKIDGFTFNLQNERKRDGVLVWRCCRCRYGHVETNASFKLLKMSSH